MSNLFDSARFAESTNQESDYVEEGECFVINYPYSVSDGEISTTFNSDDDLIAFLETLDYDAEVYIEVPFDVTFADGSQVSVNSPQEFDTLYNDCYNIEDCYDCETQCFEIVFPFSFVSENGTVDTVNNYEELYDFFSQLSEDDTCMISYPISVEFEDGTQQTANSDEELAALYESCE